jgi:acetolactate synthase-1/3 small subunit
MMQTLRVCLENTPGALLRVAGVVTAKRTNIEKMSVEPMQGDRSLALMTITIDVEPRLEGRIMREMQRLVNVLWVREVGADGVETPVLLEALASMAASAEC